MQTRQKKQQHAADCNTGQAREGGGEERGWKVGSHRYPSPHALAACEPPHCQRGCRGSPVPNPPTNPCKWRARYFNFWSMRDIREGKQTQGPRRDDAAGWGEAHGPRSRGQWVRIRGVKTQNPRARRGIMGTRPAKIGGCTLASLFCYSLSKSTAIPLAPPPRLSHATDNYKAEPPIIASPDGKICPQNGPYVKVPLKNRGGGAAESLCSAHMPGRCLVVCRHGGGNSPKLERPPFARHCHAPDGCSCCPRRGCARAR